MVRQSLWMLLATFLFAVVALLVKMASDFYSVWEIIFYRSIFGGGALRLHPEREAYFA